MPAEKTPMPARGDFTRSRLGVSRRGVLAGAAGTAAIIAIPDLFAAGRVSAATIGQSAQSAGPAVPHFFVYGIAGPQASPGASVQAARPPALRKAVSAVPVPIGTDLATEPVRSPDQATIALVTVGQGTAGAVVTLTLIDTLSAVTIAQRSLTLPGVGAGANVLATPVFAGPTTVALVLAITVPTNIGRARKLNPVTGQTITVPTATWISHHELAYFDWLSGSFAGPYDLADGPSLALSSAVADEHDLFVWTVDEAAALLRGATQPMLPPATRFAAFPLGSGTARLSVPTPGVWPAGEPVVALPTGDVARLVNARHLEVYSATTGRMTQVGIAPLAQSAAKPGAVAMSARPDGTLFITKAATGRAVVLDPAASFAVTAQISFPPPASPLGAPWSKAVLSADGATLYVLGAAQAGGLSAYDVASGALTASYSHGERYVGVYELPSGALLAVGTANPRLTFFSPELTPLGTAETSLHVAAVC
jgi:hypothetical protein